MKRSTGVWTLLLALGIAAGAWQALAPPGHEDAHGHGDAAPDLLLPGGLAGMQAIEIHQGERVTRFERDASGRWFHHQHAAPSGLDVSLANAHRHGGGTAGHRHESDAAAAERIEAALATFGRTRVERRIALNDASELAEYGLQKPRLLALVFAAGAQPVLRLAVGDAAPDQLVRYAHWPEQGAVVIVPGYQIDNLIALAERAHKP